MSVHFQDPAAFSEERIAGVHWMGEIPCPCRGSTPDRPTHSLVTIATKLLQLIKSCMFFGLGHFCNVFSFTGSVVTPSGAKVVFCSHSNLNISISSSHSSGGGIYKQTRANSSCPLRFSHYRWYYIGFHYKFPEAGTFSYKVALQKSTALLAQVSLNTNLWPLEWLALSTYWKNDTKINTKIILFSELVYLLYLLFYSRCRTAG
jgi:hypothetical protein